MPTKRGHGTHGTLKEHKFFFNLLEFSGQSPAFRHEACEVFVNTLNAGGGLGDELGGLGDLTLLNCHRIVFPLTLEEEGFEAYTLHDWCRQCHRKNGLVLWPRFPGAWGERLPNLLLGNIDAVEWTAGADFAKEGLSEWYRLLNLGLRVPLVGGSGKTSNETPIGAVRTFALVAQAATEQEFHYRGWIESIRLGRCFATRGPLLRFEVNGQGPGSVIHQAEDAPLAVRADAKSVVPFERLEVVCNGQVIAETPAAPDEACLAFDHSPTLSGWLAARCYGADGLMAHGSPVYVLAPQRGLVPPVAQLVAQPVFDRLASFAERVVAGPFHPDRRRRLLETLEQAKRILEERPLPSPP